MKLNLQSLSGRRQRRPDTRRQRLPASGGHTWKDWTMSNPVALITGGLSGIGRAAAIAFANRGAKVTVPMGPLGLSEELANAIVFIASDEASFIYRRQSHPDHRHQPLQQPAAIPGRTGP
jgi:hypothetical protein